MISSNPPLLLLVDGHSLAFRAYYAFAKAKKGPLQTKSGIPTSICFGFLNSLLQVLETQRPNYVVIAFDLAEPTFRHQADSNYKAGRAETPPDFIPDLDNLQELLAGLNLPVVTARGYEADDVIGTLAHQASLDNYQVKILTGDRDLFQLVDDGKQISVLYLDRNLGKYNEFKAQEVEDKLTVKPSQIIDYKALCGDKSDNIPGVTGIGEKTASKLLLQYQTLENIYAHLEEIKGTTKTKLIQGKESAFHSQYLAKIITAIPIDIDLENYQLKGFETGKIIPQLEKLELNSFLNKINYLQKQLGGNATPIEPTSAENKQQQLSLFSAKTNTSVVNPKVIDSITRLKELIEILKTKINPECPVAWDTETSSLNPREAKLVGIGCCWGQDKSEIAYIPLGHTQGKQLAPLTVIEALKPILEDANYPKAFQNTKFDRLVLLAQGIKLAGVVFDTMLASYVLQPENSHKLSSLCRQYLSNINAQDYEDLGIPKDRTIADLDIDTVAEYCGLDCHATYHLVSALQAKLTEISDLQAVFTLEMQLEPILTQMESNGVIVDEQYLQQLSRQIAKDLVTIERKAYEYAGREFNLGSPKQLSDLLFNELGLDKGKSRKTKTGYSTNHAILEKLQGGHPIIDSILEHRTLAKLKSTYIDSLPTLINPKTKRIHTDYNQAVTTTGRLSSSNPNLQNIPIRSEFSRQIRKAFIPQKDWLFLSADYSQIELRILAHLSQEPILLAAYRRNQDIHTVTAKLLFNKDSISPRERSLGKTINFGVIYGMGAQKFAREAKVSVQEAQRFIDIYREKYPQIFAYLETKKKEAIANGYVKTILGRRRYFAFTQVHLKQLQGSEPSSINLSRLKLNNYDAQLLRAAANAPIQGSSADIIKMAMIKVAEILKGYRAKLLLQVHDELVLEIPPTELDELKIKIKEAMENVVNLSVPLVVDIHTGENWMEAK